MIKKYQSRLYMSNIFTFYKNVSFYDQRIFWKGKTFNQITSVIRQNQNNASSLAPRQLLKPLPQKIYRRELNIKQSQALKCNPRISSSITMNDMPGSSIIRSYNNNNVDGLVNTLDIHYENNNTQHPTTCTSNCITSPAQNAKRRVRSAGMIPRKYNINKNSDNYCTGTNQYLNARNRSFAQNQYNYLRQGDPTLTPNGNLYKTNVYSTGDITHCYNPTISVAKGNNTFQYTWYINSSNNAISNTPNADGSYTFTLTIPDGVYTIESLNSTIKNQMAQNRTYILSIPSYTPYFLFNFAYDNIKNKVLLQCFNLNLYTNPEYYDGGLVTQGGVIPAGSLIQTEINSVPNKSFIPKLTIPSGFGNVIGFTAGTYSPNPEIVSNKSPVITSQYLPVYYKPNNKQFARQGAVSSSERTLRDKYNTITNVGARFRTTLGNNVGNAMAYGVSENPYTIKDQLGYPLTKTPKFTTTGELRCVQDGQKCHKSLRTIQL
jgi:hypothetical protein